MKTRIVFPIHGLNSTFINLTYKLEFICVEQLSTRFCVLISFLLLFSWASFVMILRFPLSHFFSPLSAEFWRQLNLTQRYILPCTTPGFIIVVGSSPTWRMFTPLIQYLWLRPPDQMEITKSYERHCLVIFIVY